MSDPEPLDGLQQAIGYTFKDAALLEKAMTHSSLVPHGFKSYERLEFLGDAVAGLVIAQTLFELPERWSEGEMTAIKSQVVSRSSMAVAGERLHLRKYLRVDKSLEDRAEFPPSLLADSYEALVGAIFLDGGMDAAREFVMSTLGHELQEVQERRHTPNFKSILQQIAQGQGQEAPVYRTIRKEGPDHDSNFLAAVYVGGEEKGSGWAKNKKAAEQKAAEDALGKCHPDWNRDRLSS